MSHSSSPVSSRSPLIWLLLAALIVGAGLRGLALYQTADGPLPQIHTVKGTTAHQYANRLAGKLEAVPDSAATPGATPGPGPGARHDSASERASTNREGRGSRRSADASGSGGESAPLDLNILSEPGVDAGALPVDLDALRAMVSAQSGTAAGAAASGVGSNLPAGVLPGSAGEGVFADGAGLLSGGAGFFPGGAAQFFGAGASAGTAGPVDLSPVPKLLATMIEAWGGSDPIWQIIFQLAAGGLSILLLALTTGRVLGSGAAGTAVALVTASATLLGSELIVGPAPLTLLLLLTAIWLLTRASDEHLMDWILAGAALGALALTDPGFGPVFGVAIIVVRIAKIRVNDRLRALWPMTLGGLVIVVPALSTVADSLIAGGLGALAHPMAASTPSIDLAVLLGFRDPAAPLGFAALAHEAPILQWMPVSLVVLAPLAVAGLLTGTATSQRPWPLLIALAWVLGRVVLAGPTAVDRVLLTVLLAPWAAAGGQAIFGLFRSRQRLSGGVAALIVVAAAAGQWTLRAEVEAPSTALNDARLLAAAIDQPQERHAAQRGEWAIAAEVARQGAERFARLDHSAFPAARTERASRLLRQSMYLRRSGDAAAADAVGLAARRLLDPGVPGHSPSPVMAQVNAAQNNRVNP